MYAPKLTCYQRNLIFMLLNCLLVKLIVKAYCLANVRYFTNKDKKKKGNGLAWEVLMGRMKWII